MPTRDGAGDIFQDTRAQLRGLNGEAQINPAVAQMEEGADGSASGESKDESSIKPVSSLRSRFETLGKGTATPPLSPVVGRAAFFSPAVPLTNARPSTPVRESTWATQNGARTEGQTLPQSPKRVPSPPKSRSQSVFAGTPPPPPLVTVDSPRSPGKQHAMSVDLGASRSNPILAPLETSRTGTDSPPKLNARPPSRVPTPALEARISAFIQPSTAPKAASDGVKTAPSTPILRPIAQISSVPPPVNRAGKPQIPLKPTNLTKKPEGLSAPEPSAELTDQSISPFSTPPGSRASSPHRRMDSNVSHARTDSDPRVTEKPRGNSDASWVESVRTNSNTSSAHRVRHDSDTSFIARARAGSNASFVEASTLPDSWHHSPSPPIHQTIAPRRDQLPNGVSRPARYRPIGSQERTAAGDLPDFFGDRPRLPVRPELQARPGRTSPPKPSSGRTSPLKQVRAQRSMDLKRSATFDTQPTPQRIPASKPAPRSALTQGFDRNIPPPTPKTAHIAPAIPAPRRSMDRRRETPPPAPPAAPTDDQSRDDEDDVVAPSFEWSNNHTIGPSDYPDSSQASRRPPRFKQRPWHISTDYDTRTFAVCGEYVCTTGHRTKAWSLRTGEQVVDLEHHEVIKVSSLVFKPSGSVEDEGKRVWLGSSIGEIHELDIPSQSIVKTKAGAHQRRDIIRMFRYASELWTLDDGGELNVWKPDQKGMPSLDSQYISFRTPKGHTFSIALGNHLWIAVGKEIRVFAPSAKSDTEFHVLWTPLSQPGTGEIHSGATLSGKPGRVYFGHQDGKVSIYNRHDFSCTGVVNVSMYKISSLAGVGEYLWAGFNTGMAYVYDTSTTPWRVKKDWQAHEKQICGISAERSAMWKMDRLQVVTLGTDNMLRIWDGMLEEDWLDSRMLEHDSEYCYFREITAAVLTWNAGASKPYYLQQDKEDDKFFQEYITAHEPPDIFVFGFQEMVDLEDKKVTAKTFFKSKKKDANEQEHMSHQYRAWRDHLTRCIDDYTPPSQSYVLLHTASLVGLFTCVFVKLSLKSSIKHVQAAEVKRGMGGIYGNKGALVLRMVLDDSSLCFINCHLAAGQTQTIHRNNDIAAILEAEALPPYPLNNESVASHADVFTSGGDGSMILDHEICILNGDLNYRIDTMGRDTVIKHVNQNNLSRLLERDQLLLSKKKNPGFRLRAFQESEIRFSPTYKYNLHTDEYDTSEKRRAPAWCDRILYRGVGKVKMEEYRRWDVRVSDHRPVSGWLRMRVKTVDAAKRQKVDEICRKEFEEVSRKVARAVQLEHLTDVLGLSQKEASKALDRL